MSTAYIRTHWADIKKYANAVEKRLDDEDCTMERILEDNKKMLKLAQKYKLKYILIDGQYEVNIDRLADFRINGC